MNSQQTVTALIIGVAIGVAVWSATHNGVVLPVLSLLFAGGIVYRQAHNLKNVQTELDGIVHL